MRMTSIAVLGAGNIGEALISGLVASGVDPKSIIATNPSLDRGEQLKSRYGIRASTDNIEAAHEADIIFLCVKPQRVVPVIEEISGAIVTADDSRVLVSLAAGISIATMEEAASSAGTPVARVMPNTPMLVGKGVLAVAYGRFVEDARREDVDKLLSSAGQVVHVEEKQMDAVTAISGSGPAYFFYVAEALIDAGVSLGLPRELAERLACATAEGAGAMLAGEASPVELRASVSSPAGTTARAIRELEESGVRGAFYRATEACARRSGELGSQ